MTCNIMGNNLWMLRNVNLEFTCLSDPPTPGGRMSVWASTGVRGLQPQSLLPLWHVGLFWAQFGCNLAIQGYSHKALLPLWHVGLCVGRLWWRKKSLTKSPLSECSGHSHKPHFMGFFFALFGFILVIQGYSHEACYHCGMWAYVWVGSGRIFFFTKSNS